MTNEDTENKAVPMLGTALLRLVAHVAKIRAKEDEAWLELVQYVKDNGTSRGELISALLSVGEMKEITVKNEVSVILKLASDYNRGLLDDVIDRKITVREAKTLARKGKSEYEKDN